MAKHKVRGREAIKRQNLGLQSVVMTTLHYANGKKKERSCLEAELAIAREWAVKAQESLNKLQESHDLLQE